MNQQCLAKPWADHPESKAGSCVAAGGRMDRSCRVMGPGATLATGAGWWYWGLGRYWVPGVQPPVPSRSLSRPQTPYRHLSDKYRPSVPSRARYSSPARAPRTSTGTKTKCGSAPQLGASCYVPHHPRFAALAWLAGLFFFSGPRCFGLHCWCWCRAGCGAGLYSAPLALLT